MKTILDLIIKVLSPIASLTMTKIDDLIVAVLKLLRKLWR